MKTKTAGPLAIWAAILSAQNAVAAPVVAGSESEGVSVLAGGGQGHLAARLTNGSVEYRACAQDPCKASSGDPTLPLPVGTQPSDVTFEKLAVGGGRHVLWVHTSSFGALLAAAPGAPSEARILWSGAIGFSKGEPGEKYGEQIQIGEPEDDKTVRVLLGDVREDVSLCGRPTLLSPKLLDPKDLAWKAAKVQRLRRDEREHAVTLEAVRSDAPADLGHVLQGASASSGIGAPAALTDGNLETTWSENRGGDGKGEFVQFNAPSQVEITSISIVVRPKSQEIAKGAAPRRLWLATPDALFAVNFSEDAWAHPGASYEVKPPAAFKTNCIALALDEGYAKGRDPDVAVTLTEVSARTEFDGASDPRALVGALAGGGARARAAAAILTRSGDSAYQAIIEGYPSLDDDGRVLALEVVDNAPCSQSAPLYLKAFESGRPGEVRHAEDRLMRCQRDAIPALSVALASGTDRQKAKAATLLALLAPEIAVEAIVSELPKAKLEPRAELRAALTKAILSPKARTVVETKLGDRALSSIAAIDLVRAATAASQVTPALSSAFARLATAEADFRTRFLLLRPASVLAKAGDSNAAAFLKNAVTADPDAHVRARAAEVLGDSATALEPLGRALADRDPRVRDASLLSIARLVDQKEAKVQPTKLSGHLTDDTVRLLSADPFTFVRAHAADALSGAPAGDSTDGALGAALDDTSAQVRARSLESLARRGARGQSGAIRERLDDPAETLDVKVRAVRALGRICDESSVDRLTDLARGALGATGSSAELVMAASAAAALGRLHPPDLAKRLASLSDKAAPRLAQEVARAALDATDRCR